MASATFFLLALTAVAITWTIVRNVFFSPLRNVPGPFLAKLTDSWLLVIDLAGQKMSTVHRLHQQHGPVVRIGPNELSFSSAESLRQIYGPGSDFTKASIYKHFGRHAMFQMQDSNEHRERRRLLAPAFPMSHLYQMEPLIAAQLQSFITLVRFKVGEPLDLFYWTKMLSLDIAGDLLLGKSFGSLTREGTMTYALDLDNLFLVGAIKASFPITHRILQSIPSKGLQQFLDAENSVYRYGYAAFDDYLERFGRDSARKDLLTKVIKGDDSSKAAPLTDEEISIEVSNVVFAATTATGTTLTYILWNLARLPEWQRRLREELEPIPSSKGVVSYKDILKLPILDSIVLEVLRLHAAFPSSLPRIPPPGGAQLEDVYIPENTVVSTQAFSTHRDPTAFPSPDTFDPERWIKTNGGTNEMKELFQPFSKGARNCIGQNLAMMELKIITASFCKLFRVSIASTMKDDDMEMVDHFQLFPKGKRCPLVVEPVEKS